MKFLSLLKDKRFRYGTMSTAMMIIAIVIFVLVNLLADEFNQNWDLTAEQLYTLTPQSERFLETLDMDITLTYVTRTGGETHRIVQLFAEYSAASSRITTEQRDPTINPAFLHQFATDIEGGIPDGSVIVQSPYDFRVIHPRDMGTWARDQQTGQVFRASYEEESEITQAIHSLTLGEPRIIYHIIGSGEAPLPLPLVDYLRSENFIIRTHDAVLQDIPETAEALFITTPQRDWGVAKADRILDYLENNEGRAFIAMNLLPERFEQLDRVLQAYGLRLGDYIIFEGNAEQTIMNTPFWILPMWEPHEHITIPLVLQGFSGLLFELPTGIEILERRRTETVIQPLFTTSRDAYGRLLTTDEDTIHRVPEDVDGPFNMAVAVTDTIIIDVAHTTRIVMVSNTSVLNEATNAFIGGGNWAFISASLNWLQEQPAGIWVPVRRPAGAVPIVLSDAQVIGMTGVVMGVLPIGLFAAGVFIWFRRRHS